MLQSFNTWAFKREQPSHPGLLLEVMSRSIERGEPIPFVLYWGKGPRHRVDHHDLKCLDYLAALRGRVREAYEPGAAITLIFTDTHAMLNGHTPQNMLSYFDGIDAVARERGFGSCRLSQLTSAAEAAAVQADNDDVSEHMLMSLAACAAKWFRGEGTPEQGALKYYRMNMLEKKAVEFAFRSAVFITFNGSEYRSLFPERLPIFYMYSLQRGVAVKPWFLGETDPACGLAEPPQVAAPAPASL